MNDKLKNYATTPEVWERIEKTMRLRAVRRQAWTAAAGVAVVALAVVGVVLWPGNNDAATTQPTMPEVAQVVPQAASVPVVESVVDAAAEGSQAKQAPNVVPGTSNKPVEVLPTVNAPIAQNEKQTVSQPAASVPAVSAPIAAVPVVVAAQAATPAVSESQAATQPEVESPVPAKSVVKAQVVSNNEDTILWLPNVFMPGSDDAEINVFRARINHPGDVVTNYRMTIFSRNGNQVFMSNDINSAWDGTFRGREMPQSAYVYIIYYTDKDGFRHQRKGTVTLVR